VNDEEPEASTLDADLLLLLACPVCESRPPLQAVGKYLVCTKCHTMFPVVDGVPQLTPEDGIPSAMVKEEYDD
jgi:uncharacterized protein YbaR (Trm112 family)